MKRAAIAGVWLAQRRANWGSAVPASLESFPSPVPGPLGTQLLEQVVQSAHTRSCVHAFSTANGSGRRWAPADLGAPGSLVCRREQSERAGDLEEALHLRRPGNELKIPQTLRAEVASEQD